MKSKGIGARHIALGAALILVGALGAAGVWIAVQPRVEDAVSAPAQPVVLEQYTAPIQVSLKPVMGPSLSPRLYGGGTLRAFDCSADEPWISGESNITLDDRPIRNLALPSPPWRALQIGDRGPDVTELQQALRGLGYDIAADGVFGTGTREAWRDFIDDSKAEGAALDDFVWMPPGFIPSSCDMTVGDIVAGPVAPATGAKTVASFSIETTAPLDGDKRVVVVNGEQFPQASGEIADPAAISRLMEMPLVIGALASEDAVVAATLELAQPIEAARVSAAAIITDGETACVASNETTYPVTIIDSALGRTIVSFDGDVPSEVDIDRQIDRC